MYFAFGWPKVYSSGINETFIDVSHNSDGSLIGLLSISGVSIWSGDQHRIHLGYVIRSEDSINKFGRNQSLSWCPDSSAIAIVTSTGFILVYLVERDLTDVLQLRFHKDHHSPILHNDKRRVVLKFSSSFRPSNLGALCITGNTEYIFIFTREGYLVRSSWTGELISQFSLDVVPFDGVTENTAGSLVVKSVHYTPSFPIFGLVFQDGSSAILRKHSKDRLRGYWLARQGSVAVSLNVRHRLAAVGLENGEVAIYKLPAPVLVGQNEESSQTCQLLRTFSLFQFREVTPDEIGPISVMSWTNDGNCLAVGWRNRGLCTWSVYGCKLTCTIPQMSDSGGLGGLSRYTEPFREGVLSLSWGPEGYHLILLSNGNEVGEFLQLTFLKSGLASNTNLNYSERIILQTEDRLMLLNYKGKELGDIRWKHLQIPSAYLNDNWPIKHIALSRDRSQFAVAGRRGIILYNSLSKRWKMFGDRNQEQEIQSLALTWYKHTVIIANHSQQLNKCEFLIYPKQHLDHSSLLHKSLIPSNQTPALIDCNDAHLALLTNESFFYLYRVVETDRPGIDLYTLHILSMAIPSTPLSLSLLPPINSSNINISNNINSMNSNSSTSTPTTTTGESYSTTQLPPLQSPRSYSRSNNIYCLLLHTNGRLILSNAENAAHIDLSSNIEQYWFTNIYRDRELVGNTLWGYGLNGIQVWFPFTSEEIHSTRTLHHNRSLSFDNEVYPVGFLSELGVIVGLAQGIAYSSCSQYPCYDLHIKTHPFLHSILKHLLERGGIEKTISLSSRFHTIPHFTHSLELLLHETHSTSKVDQVVSFLKHFPQFPEVAMRCARKIDATHWADLFSHIGDPVALYQKCLQSGKIEIAASYLKILQNLESNEFSQRCALDMLEIVLDFDNIDLAGDLIRFMEPEDDDLSPTIHNKLEQEKIQILNSYASKLLKSKLLRNFLLFSRKVNTQISHFLSSEKRSTILRTTEELDMALNSIHVQFYINLPADQIPPFSPASVLAAFSPAPSPTSNGVMSSSQLISNSLNSSGGITNTNNNNNSINNNINNENINNTPNLKEKDEAMDLKLESISSDDITSSSITRDEVIESLKSRIQMAPNEHHHHHHHHYTGQQGLVSSSSTESINSLSNSTTTIPSSATIYSFKSHQFMVAPSFTNFDVNDPSFLQNSIDSSMDDLYFLLQELTNAGCNEWVLVIATVLLNPALICKTLKKIPNIYENYCKMLSHQKPQGYSQLLKFIEDTVYPHLLKSSNISKKYGGAGAV